MSEPKKIEVYDPDSRVLLSQYFLDQAAADFEAAFGTRDVLSLLDEQVQRRLGDTEPPKPPPSPAPPWLRIEDEGTTEREISTTLKAILDVLRRMDDKLTRATEATRR